MEIFTHIQSFWTVIAFMVFIGIVIWAWSSRRKKDFNEAANLIFDDDENDGDRPGKEHKSGEQKHV